MLQWRIGSSPLTPWQGVTPHFAHPSPNEGVWRTLKGFPMPRRVYD